MAQQPRTQATTGEASRSPVATPAATVPSGATVKVQTPPAAVNAGPTKRVVAVASFQGGTPAEPETVAPGKEVDLPEKEARRLVDLGLARWPGEAASVVSPYDEAIKDTTAKIGEGKAEEAEQRVENHSPAD
ncbi:hypothetical protein [Roseomonas xinghualingensis]|uniref:hypothetical protein n=1 Tax=Roseomonas xinghualingensis TaxID=2986475 RepID=UPI0021F238F2|nr:hypothetical protein [Roseomonas sp. SXEYE001]MCV4207566.1 hypothetical protein [Roseomonas sp. SXEYE001]